MRLYTERLVRLAYTYVRDQATAEDRVQDAFIQAYASMNQLKNPGNPFPWLARIVINECRSFRRKGWREVTVSVLPERSRAGVEETYLRDAEFREVHHALQSLPAKYRTPIILFYFEGLSTQDIAEVLETNAGTVRTRLARGRKLLSRLLQEGEDDELRPETQGCKTLL